MVELGFLIPDRTQDRLRVGLPVLRLGYAALANQTIGEIAKPYMEKVARRYEGAVSLGTRDGLSMVYLQRCHGSSIILSDLGIGSRVSLAFSATGWAYIAGTAAQRRDRLIREIRKSEGQRWSLVEPAFNTALRSFKQTGYIINKGSLHPLINAVAVPIQADDKPTFLTLSSGGISSVFTADVLHQVGSELLHLAEMLAPAVSKDTRA